MPSQYDIDHAAFVREAYRYATVEDASVKARNPEAREVRIDTNLDLASAQGLAGRILAENNQPRAFQVVLEGTGLFSLAGGPPSVVINDPRQATDGVARKVFSISEDYERNRTTIEVRG